LWPIHIRSPKTFAEQQRKECEHQNNWRWFHTLRFLFKGMAQEASGSRRSRIGPTTNQ
jgi:hypothetical protein